jgi:hypothetical protein
MHSDHVPCGHSASRHASLGRGGVAGFAATVLAMIAACPGSASSSKAAPWSTAATSAPTAARPSLDAGAAVMAAPASVEKAFADFRGAIGAIHAALLPHTWNDWQVMANNPERKDRLAWLATDFGAKAFRQADRVDEAHLHAQTAAGLLHVGLLVAHFPRCGQLTEASSAVVKAGRSNFALPVLTMFRSKARGHSLLFLLSETHLQPHVAPMHTRTAPAPEPPPSILRCTEFPQIRKDQIRAIPPSSSVSCHRCLLATRLRSA